MKKILVTGITGFAGGFLAEHLSTQEDIQIFGTYLNTSSLEHISHSKSIEAIQLDLNDAEKTEKTLLDIKPDQIYHLAALTSASKSFHDPSYTITNNIAGQVNLLEGLRKNSLTPRVFITSSAEVYGMVTKEDLPVDELTPFRPVSPYAVSKITQDYLGYQYFAAYKIPVIRVRPFNHIGPRQSSHFVTSAFGKQIAEIEKGKIPPVLKVGNLEAKRDFTDVHDMVLAYTLLMEKGEAGEVYNIGSGVSHKISDVLDMFLSLSTVKITVEKDPALFRPSDNPEIVCDSSKMKKVTGWEPKTPIHETIKKILDYWRGIV